MQRILYVIPLGGGLPIFGYGLFLTLGFLAALFLARRRAIRAGLSRDAALDVGLIGIAAGVIGARLAYLAFDYHPVEGGLAEWLAVWQGGLTFQGGFFLALLAVWLYLRLRRIPFSKMADVYAPSLALGIGLGRLGCLMNGCCWGRIAAAGSWLGMYFPEETDSMTSQYWFYESDPAGWSVLTRELGFPEGITPILPIYATQLASALGLFLIVLGLIWAEKRFRPARDGQVMAWFLIAYGIGRFLIEFWRDDTPLRYGFGAFPGLKLGQWLALVMLAAGLAWLAKLARGAGMTIGGRK